MRLDEIETEYGDRVNVVWHSFLLRPVAEPRPVERFAEYTKSWARPASMEPKVRFNPWPLDAEPPSHSLPSAVAGKVAAGFGPEPYKAFHHGTMKAYFTDNRTISDRQVLLDIAAESGMDRDAFDRRWQEEGDELLNVVVQEHQGAIGSGIQGVPALVVGAKYLVGGAVDVADYREVIDRFAAERDG